MFVKSIYIVTTFCVLLFLSCMDKGTHLQQNKKEQQQKTVPKIPEQMDNQELSKLSPEEATAKFGKLLKSESFDLSQPLSEFRIELYNAIPEKDRHSAAIKIQEYTWSYNNTDNMTIWYQLKADKLIFLHYNIWPKGATF